MLGQEALVVIDQPIGSHCAACGCMAPANFGRIAEPSELAGQEAYYLGVYEPMQYGRGRIAAEIRRPGQKTSLWVVSPDPMYGWEIRAAVAYQEDAFDSEVLPLRDKSCGGILLYEGAEEPLCLLIRSRKHSYWGFPKGHMEMGESEEDTARREILEETGQHVRFIAGFRESIPLSIVGGGTKELVLLLARCDSMEVTLSEEHVEYRWLPLEEAAQVLSFPNDREVYRQAIAFYSGI